MTTDAKNPMAFLWGGEDEFGSFSNFNNFDGEIYDLQYVEGEYGLQLEMIVRPEGYEYEHRQIDFDPDSDKGMPKSWFSLGSWEAVISDDGYNIIQREGGPFATCKGAKLMRFGTEDVDEIGNYAPLPLIVRKNGQSIIEELNKLSAEDDVYNLRPFVGTSVHFLRIQYPYNQRGSKETKYTEMLWPVAPPVGKALGDAVEETEADKNKSNRNNRNTRNNRNDKPSETVVTPEPKANPVDSITDEALESLAGKLNEFLDTRNGNKILRRQLKVVARGRKYQNDEEFKLLKDDAIVDKLIDDGYVNGDENEVSKTEDVDDTEDTETTE